MTDTPISLSELEGHVRPVMASSSVMPGLQPVYHAAEIASVAERSIRLFSHTLDEFEKASVSQESVTDKQAFEAATSFARLGADTQGVMTGICYHMVALSIHGMVSLEAAHKGHTLAALDEDQAEEMSQDIEQLSDTTAGECAHALTRLSACSQIGTVRGDNIRRFMRLPFYYLSHLSALMGEVGHPYGWLYAVDQETVYDYMYGNRMIIEYADAEEMIDE